MSENLVAFLYQDTPGHVSHVVASVFATAADLCVVSFPTVPRRADPRRTFPERERQSEGANLSLLSSEPCYETRDCAFQVMQKKC